MSKPPEQLHAEYFYDRIGLKDRYSWVIDRINNSIGPSWVKTAMNSLNRHGSNRLEVITGSYKVAVIDRGQGCVYTMEILSENKMLQKEKTYEMLRQVPEKMRVKLPIQTFHEPINKLYVAYFTLTDYCHEVFTLLEHKKFPTEDLDTFIVPLMKTYRTLCDHQIYLIDIKPENMLLCADGLYFIDVDDVSVVRDDFIRISKTRTRYYSTCDYDMFLKERENFDLPEIRDRLEYEGWQALVKTYFSIKTGREIKYAEARARNNGSIEKYIVGVLNPFASVYDKNWKIRAWLENVQSTSQPMDLGLTAIKHLRF